MDNIITNKAITIERCLKRINEEFDNDEKSLLNNYQRQDALSMNLIRACEACLDMGLHVIRVKKLPIPQRARDIFSVLADEKIISATLMKNMHAMVGFRNIAVHDYQAVRADIIIGIVKNHLVDIDAFKQALLSLG